jgi:hypothetical protein
MMEPHSWQAGASAWFSKVCLCSSERAARERTSCWVTGMGPVEELSLETRLSAEGIRFANGGRESLDRGRALRELWRPLSENLGDRYLKARKQG